MKSFKKVNDFIQESRNVFHFINWYFPEPSWGNFIKKRGTDSSIRSIFGVGDSIIYNQELRMTKILVLVLIIVFITLMM